MVSKRTENILESVVKEYVRGGEPVSSTCLYRRYNFGIRPAMIRSELSLLTGWGYLLQPHHSSGRIPSNKGYEFFVNRILSESEEKHYFSEKRGAETAEFIRDLSERFGVFAIAKDGQDLYKTGMENLIGSVSWESKKRILEIIRDIESIEDSFNDTISEKDNKNMEVFIGRKSPYTKSKDISVLCAFLENGTKCIKIITVGPTRMEYESLIKILKSF